MNDRPTLDEIRARCALPVTEIVANPGEYYRVQTILRDRAELLRLHDALAARLAEAERERGLRAGERQTPRRVAGRQPIIEAAQRECVERREELTRAED